MKLFKINYDASFILYWANSLEDLYMQLSMSPRFSIIESEETHVYIKYPDDSVEKIYPEEVEPKRGAFIEVTH